MHDADLSPRLVSGYSERWFASFLDTMPPERTAAECGLIARWLPRPEFRKVLSRELFTPEEMDALAASCGLRRLDGCAGFDPACARAPDVPRMQLLYEASATA